MKMPRIAMVLAVFTLLAIGVSASVSIHRSTSRPQDNRLQVVAAENFWGDIAAQIGGNAVRVTSIMSDPSVDPHMYESNAHDLRALSQAQVVIMNGLGYDDFMNKLLETSAKQSDALIIADRLHITGDTTNPHIWYDITRAPEAAQVIEREFVRADPEHEALYQQNLASFTRSIEPLVSQMRAIRQQHHGEAVAYTERLPEYLLRYLELTDATPTGFASAVEDGNDPSPKAQHAMTALINERDIKILFYNAQATTPITERIRDQALHAGVPVVGVSETIPRGMNYQEWQKSQLTAIQNALQ